MMDRLLKRSEVEVLAGFRRSRLYEMVGEGKFPKPARIGGSVRWSLREVESWIAAHLAERNRLTNPDTETHRGITSRGSSLIAAQAAGATSKRV